MAVAVTDYAGHEIAGAILYAADGSVLLGQKVAASSIPVVQASDANVRVTNPDGTNIGGTGGTAAQEGSAYTLASDDLTPIGLYDGTSIKIARMLAASGDGLGVMATGHKLTNITIINALAVRDTSDHACANTDISLITGPKTITIYSSLNQNITQVRIILSSSPDTSYVGYTYTASGLTIAANGMLFSAYAAAAGAQGTTQVPQLAEPWTHFYLELKCTVAPASGTVSVYLTGVI